MQRNHVRQLLLASTAAMAMTACATSAFAETADAAASAAPAAAVDNCGAAGTIIVTARRKSESLQTVPVAITAFSSAKLDQANVLSTTDLQQMTPGVVVSGAGATTNTTYTMKNHTTIDTIKTPTSSVASPNTTIQPLPTSLVQTYTNNHR